ncbi:hypothetical protein N7510_000151 [Penicillium lagena]|uniref:uncharacterized protein n=1 Tax=Penicillium lagena TaxID=94218 RepID=UPI00254070D7|nr:uncharacterized protein N7510_000151 [Penicillium lagena]KAJ5623842.1 hypothetical protein N7510_000151 [Penicillium lagena]
MVAPLDSDGVNTGRGWEYIDVRQDNIGTSTYKNYYYFDTSLQEGIILADHQTRGANALLPWSEVAFQQYKAFPGSVLDRLRYIYRVTISTTSTTDIMEEAVRRGEYQKQYEGCGGTWYGFRPGNPPSDSFLALLGSKNGRGVAHMLIDHCAELGKKSIREIQVNLDISSMKFVLTR